MKLRTPLLLSLLALCCLSSPAALAQSEEAPVRQTVERYLRGLKFNDVPSLKAAFDPEAKLFFVKKDGSLGQLSQEQWYKGFEKSAGKEEAGSLSIVSIDVSGNSASVKVREDYPDSIYTDYVALLKLSSGWRIVNKVFFAERKNKGS
ncbi:MAG TPA: nuclear transport factor 2 family protein [Thermoanaerobaculia bacterium]|jgi:hypothetical protein|nr:nuclear transport factor 2 family protein [Thermoanaerobaculia bacterium]